MAPGGEGPQSAALAEGELHREQDRRRLRGRHGGGGGSRGGGLAFDSGTASAGYYIGYVSYRITPSVVDGWTLDGDSNVDAQEKAAAKALLWENMIDCENHRIDKDNDGNLDSVSANCEGVGALHIRYDGRGRGNHPGAAGSGVNWSATGATGMLGNANIIGCHRAALAPPNSRNGCTATELAGFAATGTYTPDS